MNAAAHRKFFKNIRATDIPARHEISAARATLPAVCVTERAISIAMLRALADLTIGPAYQQPDGYYLGATPNRLLLRHHTIEALRLRGMIGLQALPNGLDAAHITEAGRAKAVNHPLRLELAAAR